MSQCRPSDSSQRSSRALRPRPAGTQQKTKNRPTAPAGVNPLRLAAEGLNEETQSGAQMMIVVASAQLARGRSGVVVLASRNVWVIHLRGSGRDVTAEASA